MRSSTVASYRMVTSALWILYSLRIDLQISRSKCVGDAIYLIDRWVDISLGSSVAKRQRLLTVVVKFTPPRSFRLNVMLGGCLLSLMPKPSNSFCGGNIFFLSTNIHYEQKACHLYYSLVSKWLQCIEHQHYKVAGPSNTNHLPTSSFTVFSALYDTWQIEKLMASCF